MFTSLPDELITLVAEKLYVHDGTLANFAAASTACQSAAKDSLLEALRELKRLHWKWDRENTCHGDISSSRSLRAFLSCVAAVYKLTENPRGARATERRARRRRDSAFKLLVADPPTALAVTAARGRQPHVLRQHVLVWRRLTLLQALLK